MTCSVLLTHCPHNFTTIYKEYQGNKSTITDMTNSNSDEEYESEIRIIVDGDNPHEFKMYDYKTALAKALEEHKKNQANGSPLSDPEGQKIPLECDLCDYKTLMKYHFEEHMRGHSGVYRFSCDICGYKTIHKRCHLIHQMTHTGVNPYECPFCSYKTLDNKLFENHKKKHAQLMYNCDKCNFEARDKRDIRLHKIRMHMGAKNVLECSQCNYVSVRPSDLKRHVLTHATTLKKMCKFCEQPPEDSLPQTIKGSPIIVLDEDQE